MASKVFTKASLGWALYDWANSAFATTVMAGFFPLFFKLYLSQGTPPEESTAKLGLISAACSLCLGVLSPILGTISDYKSLKKEFLFIFLLIGLTATSALYFPGPGDWIKAALFYAVSMMAWTGTIVFYESLLPGISNSKTVDKISAFGYSLGYLGGGILFALNVWMYKSPATFGLADGTEAIKLSFLTVSIWWGLFSIPLFLWVKEPKTLKAPREKNVISSAFLQLYKTVREAKKLKMLFLFLAGYWLYSDAFNTIIKMSVDFGLSIGLKSSDLITALLLTQFIGFPAAYLFGLAASHFSPKRGILLGIAVYLVTVGVAVKMNSAKEFYILAILIGCVQGGVQSLSRSLYARFVPQTQSGEFFALFNIIGRFAAIIGPTMIALINMWTGNARLGVGSIAILFVLGALLLWKVDMKTGVEERTRFEQA